MFVFLSSGSSQRYKEDIIRALAMPAGTVLQFRYERKYLTQGVVAAVDVGSLLFTLSPVTELPAGLM